MNNYNTSNIVTCSFVVTVKNIIVLYTQKKGGDGDNIQMSISNAPSLILDAINYFPPGIFPYLLKKTFIMGITHFIKIESNNDQLIFMIGIQ